MITLHWSLLVIIILWTFLISLMVWAGISLFDENYDNFTDWENGWSDGWESGYQVAHDRLTTILDEFPDAGSKDFYLTSKQYIKYFEDRVAFNENREFEIKEETNGKTNSV